MELPGATSSSTQTEELKVFISGRPSECEHCRQTFPPGSWITLVGDAGARCLSCADLDELVFLAPGNGALTRRAHAHSALSAVVLKWSRSRKRYERQGLLVQEQALLRAEEECLADEPLRERRRERESIRRAGLDERYVAEFAARIRQLYPACPRKRQTEIAEGACLKNSGRVGRSAAAKVLDENAVHLAVRANIRHQETRYEELLGRGCQREQAGIKCGQRLTRSPRAGKRGHKQTARLQRCRLPRLLPLPIVCDMADDSNQIEYNQQLHALEKLLASVKRAGDFFVSGTIEIPLPKVVIDGVGMLSFLVPLGVDKRAEITARFGKVRWYVAAKRGRLKAMAEGKRKELAREIETAKAQLRAYVEHPFHIVKNLFRHRKVRYRGLLKNTAQLHTLFALANLIIAKPALV